MQIRRLVLVTVCSFFTSVSFAAEPWVEIAGYHVKFSNCAESIGVALAPMANVEPLIPDEFIPVGSGTPVTPLVVRTAHCDVTINGQKLKSRSIVQVGAVIIPPDGTGDINNYTLLYYTDDFRLALALLLSGVEAQFVPTIQYQLPSASTLSVRVPAPGTPRLKLSGSVQRSTTPAGAFLANWWQKTDFGLVKMSTNVPVIAIGSADLTLTVNSDGLLGNIFGAAVIGFPILQQFNTFDSATMNVKLLIQ